MAIFQFHPVIPHPLLQPYVARMWLFESSGRFPDADKKLIIPNARFKLTLTCRNGLIASVADRTFLQEEHIITLSGLIDTPVNLNPQEDTPTGTIVMELDPTGVYRLFRLPFVEIKNQIIPLPDLIGSRAAVLQRRLAEVPELTGKLHLLQRFLIAQLERTAADDIYDYCVQRIFSCKGLVSVTQLEKETGYSARWLNRKFKEHLGTSPKGLAEMMKFKQLYEMYATGLPLAQLKDQIYHYYYDQSHFLKAFKRFTGCTPTELQDGRNELATKHYTS